MTHFYRSPTKFYAVLVAVATIIVVIAVVAWKASVVEHVAIGKHSQTMLLDCDFDRFRQIMVRKNATAAIVVHSGMKLLEERVQGLAIDSATDDRPLLNAIRGKSKSQLSAVKLLTVQLNDPALEAKELMLRQVAFIEPSEINVETASAGPAGHLENYITTLHAQPEEQSTSVTLTVEMKVRVKIPKLFARRADERVQQAAVDAIVGQAEAMKKYIDEHAKEILILPELGNR